MIALLDNTVMSNFALVERPELLRAAFGSELATSQQAFAELLIGFLSLDEADDLLLQMIAAGYRSPTASLRDLV